MNWAGHRMWDPRRGSMLPCLTPPTMLSLLLSLFLCTCATPRQGNPAEAPEGAGGIPKVAQLRQPDAEAPPLAQEGPEPLDADREAEIRHSISQLVSTGYINTHGFPCGATACEEDPEDGECAEWRMLAGALLGMADRFPTHRFVQGQVVFAMVKGQAPEVAWTVVERCRAEAWWCTMLRGFILAEGGRFREAEAVFDEALLLMPDRDLCDWTDLSFLVSGEVWAEYQGASCRDRLDRLEELWWLADPAWTVAGNDRKAEHYNRMAWAALHDDLITRRPGHITDWSGHTEDHHPPVVRYGMDILRFDARWGEACGWPINPSCSLGCSDPEVRRRAQARGVPCCGDTSVDRLDEGCPYTPDAQTYQVIPGDRALLDPLHATAEDWLLDPNGGHERYVPAARTLLNLDAQVAFFERRDSLVATAAMEVPIDPAFGSLPPDSAVLFLGTAHDEPPVTRTVGSLNGRWVFRADAPRRRYVVGVETMTPEAVGRYRSGHGLPHNPTAPLRLSDLLLYTPADAMLEDSTLPDSLEAALPLMKGGHRWRQGEVMGVYLELYSLEEADSFPVSVELERERGALARLGGVLGIGGGEPANVQWMESGARGRFALSLTVVLGEAEPGDYTLRVSVTGPGMSPAVVEQRVRIEEREG